MEAAGSSQRFRQLKDTREELWSLRRRSFYSSRVDNTSLDDWCRRSRMFYPLGLPSVLVYRLLPSSALGEPTRCLLWICAFVTIDPHPREVTCAIYRIGRVQFTPTNPMVASQNGAAPIVKVLFLKLRATWIHKKGWNKNAWREYEPIYYCLVLSVYFLFPIVRLLGNTNGRPYLSVVTSKRHHATTVLNVTQVLLVGEGWEGKQVFHAGKVAKLALVLQ